MKRKSIPFYFKDHTCTVCGNKDIELFNKYGEVIKEIKKESNVYYCKCKKCKTEYILDWDYKQNLYVFRSKDIVINNFEKDFLSIKKEEKDICDYF